MNQEKVDELALGWLDHSTVSVAVRHYIRTNAKMIYSPLSTPGRKLISFYAAMVEGMNQILTDWLTGWLIEQGVEVSPGLVEEVLHTAIQAMEEKGDLTDQ